MAAPIGALGGVAVAPESTYGTLGTVLTWLHAISSTLGQRRQIVQPSHIRVGRYTNIEYSRGWVEGEISADFTFEQDVVGPLLAACGTVSTATYTIAPDTAPDTNALSVFVNHGGKEWSHAGCKPTGLRIDMPAHESAKITVPMIGLVQAAVVSPHTVTRPSEALVALPTDIGALTIGGTAMQMRSASINVELPKTGNERFVYGSPTIKEPHPSGPALITATINVDLDDTTGANSIAELADFLSATALGTIAWAGGITLTGCMMTGDPPALQVGVQEFAINVQATGLTIVTT